MERYAAAKMRIFDGLDAATGTALLPADNDLLQRTYRQRGAKGNLALLDAPDSDQPGTSYARGSGKDRGHVAVRLPWSPHPHLAEYVLPLDAFRPLGDHNVANVAAAAALVSGLESSRLSVEGLRSAIGSLQPPPHRMEDVGTFRGVRFINDSKATNLESTEVALNALRDAGLRAAVLLGGCAKKDASGSGRLGFGRLAPLLTGQRAVVTYGLDGPTIASELRAEGLDVKECGTLAEAVQVGVGAVAEGDVVLLSPACASFDQFLNFEHRGHVFCELVQTLG